MKKKQEQENSKSNGVGILQGLRFQGDLQSGGAPRALGLSLIIIEGRYGFEPDYHFSVFLRQYQCFPT